MKRTPGIVAAIAITLALTSCGATDNTGDTQAPTQEPTTAEAVEPQLYPEGPFELTSLSGAEISFELPSPANDENLAEIEQFRTDTGGSPVSYIVLQVDNRNGTEPVALENVTAFDADGNKYEFSSIIDFIDEWSPYYSEDYEYVLPDGTTLPEDEGDELQRRGVDIYNSNLGEVAVAENATIILASPEVELPGEFTRVTVFPDAFATDGEDATPAGSNDSE
ncbi:LptM family lipoprotein [Leucobacter salsicius]|uniref:LptM family lipoprotein n=1 Tax=Leucobacter salsicius TaxID=664638 RepID=UPI000379C701|nr:hypothetical protein [Leucobacter salsicius]